MPHSAPHIYLDAGIEPDILPERRCRVRANHHIYPKRPDVGTFNVLKKETLCLLPHILKQGRGDVSGKIFFFFFFGEKGVAGIGSVPRGEKRQTFPSGQE